MKTLGLTFLKLKKLFLLLLRCKLPRGRCRRRLGFASWWPWRDKTDQKGLCIRPPKKAKSLLFSDLLSTCSPNQNLGWSPSPQSSHYNQLWQKKKQNYNESIFSLWSATASPPFKMTTRYLFLLHLGFLTCLNVTWLGFTLSPSP